mmetsp:Transcript_9903/g.33082  ORF Transcript_9903/g.33082 Transcript_9903/m.33082 type:complete len:231 (+) Transcript_9903:348-1040(+)
MAFSSLLTSCKSSVPQASCGARERGARQKQDSSVSHGTRSAIPRRAQKIYSTTWGDSFQRFSILQMPSCGRSTARSSFQSSGMLRSCRCRMCSRRPWIVAPYPSPSSSPYRPRCSPLCASMASDDASVCTSRRRRHSRRLHSNSVGRSRRSKAKALEDGILKSRRGMSKCSRLGWIMSTRCRQVRRPWVHMFPRSWLSRSVSVTRRCSRIHGSLGNTCLYYAWALAWEVV